MTFGRLSILLLLPGWAGAAAIGFESESPADGNTRIWQEATMSVVGWEVQGSLGEANFTAEDPVDTSSFGSDGNSFTAQYIDIVSDDTNLLMDGVFGLQFGTPLQISLDQTVYGRSFDLVSMDICMRSLMLSPDCGNYLDQTTVAGDGFELELDNPLVRIRGYTADGSIVTGGWSISGDNQSLSFDSSWAGISRVAIYSDAAFIEGPDIFIGSGLEIDNVVVNVVPIPAAAWMFVSALGLLGGLRARS